MIRKSTVERQVARIHDLEGQAIELREQSEKDFGCVTSRVEAKAAKLDAEAEKVRNSLLARLYTDGVISSPDGVAAEESEHPILAGVDFLWDIGNGWC